MDGVQEVQSQLPKKTLPIPGKRNVLITSALPYVNNVPHLGNIVGSVLSADVFARYCKARGYQTIYICGTDEYGTATETKALEEKVTPQQLCDKYHAIHSEIYAWFNLGFDIFGRTPTRQHTEISQDVFLKLHKNGYLEERTTVQPYCEKHHSFLADRFVEGECPLCGYADARGDQCDKCGKLLDPLELIKPRCKIDGATPVPRETKHVFILLDKLQPQIEEWSRQSIKQGGWSSSATSITENWLKEGLKPRGITRDLRWGVPVPLPGYENKVLYVWFEACIGYPSITANYTPEWEKWWKDPENVQLFQFMGKDNVPFHSVIFPGCQMGSGDSWTKLHHLSATEYLNYENGKFSKSRNIGVFGNNAKDTGISSDVWRYFLISRRPEGGDTEFEWKAFIDANNNELKNNLGNFVNRIVKFVNGKNYDSVVPDYTEYTEADFDERIARINEALKKYIEEMEAVKLRAGLATAMHISFLGNQFLQQHTLDNRLAEEQPKKCAAIVGIIINLVHLLASVIEPYMPGTTASILEQLDMPLLIIPDEWAPNSVKPGHKINKAQYLFSPIKAEKEQEWRDQFGGVEAERQRAEKAAKAAKKKADKLRKQAAKSHTPASEELESVEATERDGAQKLDHYTDPVTEVTDGVHQATLQAS